MRAYAAHERNTLEEVTRLRNQAASLAHLARTVCRRAERSVITLHRSEPVNEPPRQYLNRLSDLCFVLSRVLNKNAGESDVLWENPKN